MAEANAERVAELGERVKGRRGRLGLSKDKAAELAPMSPVTWTRVEDGLSVRELTYSGVEKVLRWPSGSITAYLRTGNANLLPVEEPAEPPTAPVLADEAGESLADLAVETYRSMSRQLGQLKARLAADPAMDASYMGYMDTLDDLSSLVLAFRRGGWRGFRAEVIARAASYQQEERHLSESDSRGA